MEDGFLILTKRIIPGVYSQDYACPFAPPENWLEAPINAGEKNYLRNSMKEVE
jgi:hypothetical protein